MQFLVLFMLRWLSPDFTIYLGVTEPAIFGVNLKHTFPFVCGMIGSACAAIICVATGTIANAIGVGGIPAILSILPSSMVTFAIAMIPAIVLPFVLTTIVGKKKLNEVPADAEEAPEAEEIMDEEGNAKNIQLKTGMHAVAKETQIISLG